MISLRPKHGTSYDGTWGVNSYGYLQVRNWRWEFDANSGLWIEIESNDPRRQPCCRYDEEMLPVGNQPSLILFGGAGNATGRQGDRDPGLRFYDGNFPILGDLWLLNLDSGKWKCLEPAPGLELPGRKASAYLAKLKLLVVAHTSTQATPVDTPPEIYLHRMNPGVGFEKVTSRGEVPMGPMRNYLVALPGGERLLTFQEKGIYELRLEL